MEEFLGNAVIVVWGILVYLFAAVGFVLFLMALLSKLTASDMTADEYFAVEARAMDDPVILVMSDDEAMDELLRIVYGYRRLE